MIRGLLLLCWSVLVLSAPASAARTAPAGFWGGVYTTSTNEHVAVYSSDAYAVDEAVNQRWANFLASLVHGSELSAVSVYLAPAEQVASLCGGADIYGCYTGDRIVAPQDNSGEVTTESVLAHEYGHHIAAHRSNDPWRASTWGTKRWASYLQVCRKTRASQLFPGAESPLLYELNPGEGFAETYRVLNENRLGLPHSVWRVDPVFRPTARSLALVEQDVRDPWTANAALTLRGRFAARGASVRSFKVATPLDGSFVVSVRGQPRVRLEVLEGQTRVGRGTASATALVCGSRTLSVRVTRIAGSGSFTLAVLQP